MTDLKPDLAALAERIKQEHQAVRNAAKGVVSRAIAAGSALNEARSKMDHGQWLPWLRDHCELSERTAYNYMLLANNRLRIEGSKVATDANLTLRRALREIKSPTGVREVGPMGEYEKAQATLLKKLNGLLPGEVEAAAKRTIAELEAATTTSK